MENMQTINHEYYVSFEVAELLKEAGFDWNCKYGYIITPAGDMPTGEEGMLTEYVENVNWVVKTPTLEVAQRWLREVKGIEFDLCWHLTLDNQYKYAYAIKIKSIRKGLDKGKEIEVPSIDCLEAETCFNAFEEAQEAGVKKALELLLKKGV